MELSSSAFANDNPIPKHYTCDGSNASPPLSWSGVPRSAKALLLPCEDPDAPGGTFFHWVAFNILPDTPGLTEAAGMSNQSGFRQAVNNFGHVGYDGPCLPKGDRPHRYRFVLSALDHPLAQIAARATCAEVLAKAYPSVIASAELVGHYQRR
jgi:Raf kinase inhibitor-like YbhB/YbcL family protein